MKSDISCRVSVVVNAPATEVWDALTKPELIKKYFFGTNTKTSWRVDSPIEFSGTWQGREYKDKGMVKKYEPHTTIQYTHWSPLSGLEDKPENYMSVTYEVLERGANTTTVTIIQENIPNEKDKEHSEQNWRKVLDDLKQLLEKGVEAYA